LPSIVEIRCPVGPQRLFTKLRLGAETATYVQPENMIEFSCSDCSRRISRETGEPTRVFHWFNFLGELIQTRTAPKG
jgi:hypothetical protein